MNLLVESLNHWGERFLSLAWPLLWQSSLLIAVLLGLDFALRRRVRAAVRYALWLVVLVKLVLPPSLALPTGLGWWLQPRHGPPAKPQPTFIVTYGSSIATEPPPVVETPYTPPPPRLSRDGWAFAAWAAVSLVLLGWMGVRWRQIARDIRRAKPAPPWLDELLTAAREQAGLRRRVELRLTAGPMSPAVCGLFRPVILLPRGLVEQLPPAQLRSVLLHELIHLRRGDVWVNCAQALLQVVYWWHPPLWLANARIRCAREEAVDDAVMLVLRDDAESYAPTLLEVAKLAFHRPLASLGLVGILESRSALRQRIERLVSFRPPRKAGLTIASALGVLFFAAVALPMERAPAASDELTSATNDNVVLAQQTAAGTSNQRTEAAKLVQSGRLLQEAGNLDDAEADLRKASTLDPQNRAAAYYLDLIKETRQRQAAAQARSARHYQWSATNGNHAGSNATAATDSGTGLPLVSNTLVTRVFKIDPNTLFQNLEEHGYLSQTQVSELSAAAKSWGTPQRDEDSRLSTRTNSPGPGFLAIRAFLSNAGVELKPPESMFFNDRNGQLIVRATQPHLDLIQTLIEALNCAPPQITVDSKFIEMPEQDYRDLWAKLSHTNGPATGAWTAILTPPQVRELVNGFEAKDGVDILTAPSVTTLSGRQAQIQVVDISTIVTGINPKARSAPGVASAGGTNGVLQTEAMPFGPVLDLVPTVSEDGYTIQMSVMPTMTEFLGYDKPDKSVIVYVEGKEQTTVLPLPRFRVRQTTTSAVVWDGQTVVIGNAMPVEIFKKPDGTSAAEPATDKNLKRLIVLVTPTITDPARNRVHSDEEMPFARDGVPAQPNR